MANTEEEWAQIRNAPAHRNKTDEEFQAFRKIWEDFEKQPSKPVKYEEANDVDATDDAAKAIVSLGLLDLFLG